MGESWNVSAAGISRATKSVALSPREAAFTSFADSAAVPRARPTRARVCRRRSPTALGPTELSAEDARKLQRRLVDNLIVSMARVRHRGIVRY
jgi:hypothetical protein